MRSASVLFIVILYFAFMTNNLSDYFKLPWLYRSQKLNKCTVYTSFIDGKDIRDFKLKYVEVSTIVNV